MYIIGILPCITCITHISYLIARGRSLACLNFNLTYTLARADGHVPSHLLLTLRKLALARGDNPATVKHFLVITKHYITAGSLWKENITVIMSRSALFTVDETLGMVLDGGLEVLDSGDEDEIHEDPDFPPLRG